MMNFEDWVAQVWLPDIEPRDGRRISELLAKLTVTQFEEYYKKRYDRANERQAGAVTLSFDSTAFQRTRQRLRMPHGVVGGVLHFAILLPSLSLFTPVWGIK